jgi:hypothetical protein
MNIVPEPAFEHYQQWPSPDGRTPAELFKGKIYKNYETMWPACAKILIENLSRLTFEQKQRTQWGLYHFQEGDSYPHRWMFWKEPEYTKACEGWAPEVLPEPQPAETYYADSVHVLSEEGKRRFKANLRECHRRFTGDGHDDWDFCKGEPGPGGWKKPKEKKVVGDTKETQLERVRRKAAMMKMKDTLPRIQQ